MNNIKMKILRQAKKMAVRIFRSLYRLTYKHIKVDEKTVVFIAFHGRGYTCNPKYLHLQMLKENYFDDYRFIWALKRPHDFELGRTKKVRYNSLRYFYYMAKAKYWIVNCKLPKHILKKPDQVYLQTWHGTPLKRLAHDIVVAENQTFYRSGMSREEMYNTYDDDVSKYNYMIAPNQFSYEVFQSAFQIDAKRLIKTGYPRNDYLSNLNEDTIEQLKQQYHLPKDKKIILYAPTWRDNSYNAKGYTFELKADFHLWKEKLGSEYIVIFKPHYLIINKYENDEGLKDFIINIAADADINELYALSDILVTDYSSVFFDYANLNRPIYFYMFDIEAYAKELRGFYFDIYETLPGDIIANEVDLLDKIKVMDYNYDRLKKFNERFNAWQDGHASDKVLDIVFKR